MDSLKSAQDPIYTTEGIQCKLLITVNGWRRMGQSMTMTVTQLTTMNTLIYVSNTEHVDTLRKKFFVFSTIQKFLIFLG